MLENSIVVAKKRPEMCDIGTIYVNLGRVLMRKGLYDKARKSCGRGWRYGIDKKNQECIDEASKCIKEAIKFASA